MRLRTRTLRPGTLLFHGTSADFHPSELLAPAWFSEKPRVARHFVTWHKGGDARIIQFRVVSPLKLLLIPDAETYEEVRNLSLATDTETQAEWVCHQGYDGWICPNNYPDEEGADIMLCSTDGLEHIETSPVVESSYGMARRLDEISSTGAPAPNPGNNRYRHRMGWKPVDFGDEGAAQSIPIGIKGKPQPTRFDLEAPEGEPPAHFLHRDDLDALIQRIRDEESQPPHKQNAAKIAGLRKQALAWMSKLESSKIQFRADRLLEKAPSEN